MAWWLVLLQDDKGHLWGQQRPILVEADGPVEAVQAAYPVPPSTVGIQRGLAIRVLAPWYAVPLHVPTPDWRFVEMVAFDGT